MNYHKQFLINNIIIPVEVSEIIKSFCFYDIQTWKSLQLIKSKKNEIDMNFKNNTVSRTNPNEYFSDSDDNEHWIFSYKITTMNEIQFQATNCKYCGNYKFCQDFNKLSENIVCYCDIDD